MIPCRPAGFRFTIKDTFVKGVVKTEAREPNQ
jgi:hypothetical protein